MIEGADGVGKTSVLEVPIDVTPEEHRRRLYDQLSRQNNELETDFAYLRNVQARIRAMGLRSIDTSGCASRICC